MLLWMDCNSFRIRHILIQLNIYAFNETHCALVYKNRPVMVKNY